MVGELRAPKVGTNSLLTHQMRARGRKSSNLLAIIESKCNCAIAPKFVHGLGLKYRDLRQGGLAIVEIYVLCFGQFPNTWPSQQWTDPPQGGGGQRLYKELRNSSHALSLFRTRFCRRVLPYRTGRALWD